MPRKEVIVPKQLHGKVIGKGGATRKDIESDYGVKLTFPDRDDQVSTGIIIEGDEAAIGYAEARILDICGMNKNNEVDVVRDELQKLREEKDELFKRAYAAPKGPERDNLFNRANQAKQAYEKAEDEAAKKIFTLKNQGYGDEQMDLHGLGVEDAEKFVNQRLDKVQSRLRSNEGFTLEIITGFGHHSENNVAKIKPAIMELLRTRGFDYELDDSGGIIIVKGAGAATTTYPSSTSGQPASGKPNATPARHDDGVEAFIDMVFEFFACCFGGTTKARKAH